MVRYPSPFMTSTHRSSPNQVGHSWLKPVAVDEAVKCYCCNLNRSFITVPEKQSVFLVIIIFRNTIPHGKCMVFFFLQRLMMFLSLLESWESGRLFLSERSNHNVELIERFYQAPCWPIHNSNSYSQNGSDRATWEAQLSAGYPCITGSKWANTIVGLVSEVEFVGVFDETGSKCES